MIDYSIFAKFKQIIVIFKSFPRIKYCNNIHNNYVSIVINGQTKQKYITKASKVVHSQKIKKSDCIMAWHWVNQNLVELIFT